jgi:hypothetical protein
LSLGAQTPQDREAQAAGLLVQGDDAYAKGDYQKAIEAYLLVVENSANRPTLSRAHMGLSLCYFYLDDAEKAEDHILKLLEIDLQKEVSPLFHPQTYVDLFNKVKKENEGRLRAAAAAAAVPVETPPPPQEKPAPEAEQQIILEGTSEERGGRFEVEVHFSGWSIDLAKGAFEDSLTKRAANEIREEVTDQLRANYGGGLTPSSYEQHLVLDSQGSNYGFEVRYYPLGRRGSLSVGFSLEKTRIKVLLRGPIAQRYTDGSEAVVEGDASMETNPLTAGLSFRWDFLPSSRVTPYFIFGLGIGPLEGTAAYIYAGTYQRGNAKAAITGEEDKTFDQLREEGEIELDRFILLHTAFGIKGRIFKGLALKLEAGFWDGLILRGGLAYRF